MRDISSPLDGFSSPFGPQRNRTLQSLLFGQTEPGFTFEPWDITTLYQDRAGTTPVTAAGQSVGLRLDKSNGLALGPELVTNGMFDVNINGWSNTGSSTSAWESGAARWSAAAAEFSGFRSTSFTTIIGKTYEFTATVSENTGAAWRIILVNGDGSYSNGTDNYTATGTKTARFVATQTTSFIEIRNGTAATANRLIDNISVRELAGNHEVAINNAARGVYGWMPKTGRRNLLTYTEQFDNAAWTKSAATVTANAAVAPDGTTTADLLAVPTTAFAYLTVPTLVATPATSDCSITFWVKAGTVTSLDAGLYDNTAWGSGSASILFGPGSVTQIVGSRFSITGLSTSQWTRVKITRTAGSSGVSPYFYPRGQGTSTAGDNLYIWGAQLELGASATAYQKVVSQYDVTEAGVASCYYVQADGVDDAYVTPTITPNTDKVQVFAGIRKLSDAAAAVVIEHSASLSANAGSILLAAPGGAGTGRIDWSSKGTIKADAQVSGLSTPVTLVATGIGDISGDVSSLRINGALVQSTTTDQGTGNYLAYPAYIYGRGGTSLPFNGYDFGHAVRFGPNLDAATIARVESLIARNTPEVTL